MRSVTSVKRCTFHGQRSIATFTSSDSLSTLLGALSKKSHIDVWLEKYRKLWEDATEEIRL